ncbi:F-box domain containing protein [Tanacetum coccineum]
MRRLSRIQRIPLRRPTAKHNSSKSIKREIQQKDSTNDLSAARLESLPPVRKDQKQAPQLKTNTDVGPGVHAKRRAVLKDIFNSPFDGSSVKVVNEVKAQTRKQIKKCCWNANVVINSDFGGVAWHHACSHAGLMASLDCVCSHDGFYLCGTIAFAAMAVIQGKLLRLQTWRSNLGVAARHRACSHVVYCKPVWVRFSLLRLCWPFDYLAVETDMYLNLEDDPDIIHFDNSSDLPLSTSLNDLDNATLHIDGQSTEVDAPPDIIDVVDQDDDITDDEDALPHDLADSDDEDLINVDDDGVDKMSADVARSHGGDGGGEDRPPPHHVPTGCMGCFANRGKGKRKPNLGGRAAGRLNTRDKTRNLSLKEITDKKGPVPIRFELRDKQTLMPLGDHAAHWSSYIGEVIRGVPLYYPSWLKVPKERKAALITDIGTQFDLRPHMESPDWTEINAGIQQHLQKAYNTNKAAFKAQHWVIDPTTGTYDVEKIRRARPEDITAEEWEKYIKFWNDPRNIARAAQNRQNRAKSTVISRQGSRSLARLRDEMRQSSGTQEYPSLIDTFFVAHTVNGEFLWDEDRRIYEEMMRLEATVTYTDDEINRLARRGKQRGHILGVGRVLPTRATAGPSTPASESTLNSLHKKVDFMMSLFKSNSEYSDMFSQFESGGTSGSGG